jgi:hypothetical protein
MRKIVVFNMLTVDGYFAGLDGNIDWHQVDDEFDQFAIEQTASFGTLILEKLHIKFLKSFGPRQLLIQISQKKINASVKL